VLNVSVAVGNKIRGEGGQLAVPVNGPLETLEELCLRSDEAQSQAAVG
jgi:hypothetical protein